jgi:TonB family protein
LRQESEYACDDAALRSGIEGPEYAAHVLAVARSLRPDGRVWWPAHGIARQSGLERRFVAMLNTRLDRRPVTGSARLVTVAALLSIMLPIAAFSTAQTFSTFSGYVFDSTNRIMPGATLGLTNLQNDAKYEVRSTSSGYFEFVGLPPSEYLLESLTPGFDRPLGQVTMVGEAVQRNLVLRVASLEETATITAGETSAVGFDRRVEKREAGECNYRVSVGGNIRPPRKVRHVEPAYPAHLRGANVAGVVVLDARIGTTGFIDEVRVISTPHPDLGDAAVQAVQQWEYDWTLLNCVPVEVPMRVTVRFQDQPALTDQEPIALNLELYRNATLMGSPTVKVRDGETGTLRLRDLFSFAFTPTAQDDDKIAVSFEIHNGGETLTPRVVFARGEAGTLNWVATNDDGDREQLEVRISTGDS